MGLGGVFKSANGRETWFPSDAGINRDPTMGVAVLSVSAVNSNTYLAGTLMDGAYKSVDSGKSWVPINSGVPQYDSLRVVQSIDANNYLAQDAFNVYKSTNAGNNWTRIYIPSSTKDYSVFYIYPVNKNTYLAIVADNIIYKSIDGGKSWMPLNTPKNVYDLSIILAGTSTNSNTYLFTGDNDGFPHPCSLFKSVDGGKNWSRIDNGLGVYNISALAMIDSNTYLVANGDGMFKSADGGKSWVSITSGLPFPQ